MHGAAVCQVIQGPGAVRYEQYLVSGPWERGQGDFAEWSNANKRMGKAMHVIIPTVYRFEFGRGGVGFHTEVLHPSGRDFIHSRKIYRLPLQVKKTKSSGHVIYGP